MDTQSLSSFLSTLTQHELDYKEGKIYDFSKSAAFNKIGNENIYRLEGYYEGESIVVKKNSRFQKVPPHVHSFVEINYMFSGSCEQIINGKTLTLLEGELILIDCETVHAIGYTNENDIMISLLIHKEYLNNAFLNRLSNDSIISRFFINAMNQKTNHNNYIIFHSGNSRRLPLFMNELLCEYYSPCLNSSEILNNLFILVISELVNIFGHEMNKKMDTPSQFSIIPVLKYIETNFKSSTLENTAQFFNINPNYLTTLLKQHTGYSYKELILQQKMKATQKLLINTDMPIKEIAHAVGYDNLTFFYKKFKEHFHCLPKEYRDQKLSF
jgi:AraC-like DNA-binding protein